MQNGRRKSEGLPHLLSDSATRSERQRGRHKHRRLIAQVVVDRFHPELSELSAHAAAVCLTAITPLTASRLKWKRTGMHCGCNRPKVASDCWHRSPATWKTRSQNEHVLTDTTGTQAPFADQENFDQVSKFWDRGIRPEDMT